MDYAMLVYTLWNPKRNVFSFEEDWRFVEWIFEWRWLNEPYFWISILQKNVCILNSMIQIIPGDYVFLV